MGYAKGLLLNDIEDASLWFEELGIEDGIISTLLHSRPTKKFSDNDNFAATPKLGLDHNS